MTLSDVRIRTLPLPRRYFNTGWSVRRMAGRQGLRGTGGMCPAFYQRSPGDQQPIAGLSVLAT